MLIYEIRHFLNFSFVIYFSNLEDVKIDSPHSKTDDMV